jgi:hypothetical protein
MRRSIPEAKWLKYLNNPDPKAFSKKLTLVYVDYKRNIKLVSKGKKQTTKQSMPSGGGEIVVIDDEMWGCMKGDL